MLHLPFQTDLKIEYPPANDDLAKHLELTGYTYQTGMRQSQPRLEFSVGSHSVMPRGAMEAVRWCMKALVTFHFYLFLPRH